MFPQADPIPLPAPVWLMKLLSLLTLGLHFAAVMLLIGSLMLVIWLNFRGLARKDRNLLLASFTLAKRHPLIMTYVINLGVPPLLFLQVLYGPQIYSSSVLIGVTWISVIFLLMIAYWLLYRAAAWIEAGKRGWIPALLSLIVVMIIGKIYSMNMTLMLRPEVWNEMYQNSPEGLSMVKGDPTVMSRFLFVFLGGPLIGGLWAALLSNMVYLAEGVRDVLRKAGGMLALFGALGMLGAGYQVMSQQPQLVRDGIAGAPMYNISLLACGATILLAGVLGLVQGFGKGTNVLISTLGLVVGFLSCVTSGIVRDGIRDFVLKSKGFDVYNVQVYPNWSVLIVFLLLFVIMLGIVYWLFQVMRSATPPKEEIAA